MSHLTGPLILINFGEYCIDETYEETFEYIKKNNLDDEIQQILALNGISLCENLMKFSMRYGILSILRFMYEYINYQFNMDYMNDFVGIDKSSKEQNNMSATSMVATVDGDAVSSIDGGSLRYSLHDKYSKQRNECISYIVEMRKYSSMVSQNKKFYYKFNKKKYGSIFN